ncbi:nuclear transport factor 2 family protein [Methylocystis sp. IM3]|jgi:ketosteroid isomerase-like protein|uniref:nuclear transport factor 2 family protein n=2 Tax=Methylocystis TaxID=133 RepID=UPI000F9812CE|nr:MAG: nuclear transport factor 2 family protein [Hyphomicrobiales bacterium]
MPVGGSRDLALSATDKRFVIAEMLDCRMRRHYDRFASFVDPGVVLSCHSWREGMVGPAVWRGADGLRELFRRTDENYLPGDHEIIDVLVDGDEAVVRWRADWRRHDNGRIYTNDAAHFLRWDQGRVVEMHEFFDAHCRSTPACACLPSFETLLTPRPPGLPRGEMERRARRLLEFESGSPEPALVLKWCAPDIICDFAGDRARLPYAGRHTGVDALLGIIRAVHVDFEQRPLGLSRILIEDARAACWRQVEWRHRGTGRTGVCELADFVRFDNGLIVECIEFRDTVSLLRMQD